MQPAQPNTWNFTIDDTSSVITYSPFSDGDPVGGWETYFSSSGFWNGSPGEEAIGDSLHITSRSNASLSFEFRGTAVYLYGNASAPYTVSVDNQPTTQSPTSGDLLYSVTGLQQDTHHLNLTILPSNSSQRLWFDKAVISDSLPTGTSGLIPQVIDNQNTTALHYTGNWSSFSDVQIPSRANPKKFMKTTDSGAAVALNFTGAWAVAVNASKNWGHWTFSVALDGSTRTYNASSWWLIGDTISYYQSELDPNRTYTLELTNAAGAGFEMSLNEITLYMPNTTTGVVSPGTSAGSTSPSSHKTNVGVIVGPVIAAVVVIAGLIIGWFLFKRRHIADRSTGPIQPFHDLGDESTYIGSVRNPLSGTTNSEKVLLSPTSNYTTSDVVASLPRSVPPAPASASSGSHVTSASNAPSRPPIPPTSPSSHSLSSAAAAPAAAAPPPPPVPQLQQQQSQIDVNQIIELIAQRIDRPQPSRQQNMDEDDDAPPPRYYGQ